ncbi:non-specific lipid transfer protein GPI-anchored 31-like [Typha latifolia]|uniref:non-specific lipid transfer protein GPI-anchored 31-like n=1 Tax=Typha latifolia TaxID=4733 RepID=UPI003C2B06FA
MAMASKFTMVLLCLCFILAMSAHGAHVGAPSPTLDCSSTLFNLADCLSFVQQGSKVAKPEGGCCSGLKKVVKEDVSCLCDAFQGSQTYGINLNITKALSLPSACGVSTPPFSKCNISGAGMPAAAPAPSPSTTMFGAVSGVPAKSPMPASAAVELPVAIFTLVASAVVSTLSYYYL